MKRQTTLWLYILLLSTWLNTAGRSQDFHKWIHPYLPFHKSYICTPAQLWMIHDAFLWVAAHAIPPLTGIGGKCKDLAMCLTGKTEATVTIECGGVYDCDEATGMSIKSENLIRICGWFPGRSQDSVNSIVFHELVHLCGGTELDAYALFQWVAWWDPFKPSNFIPPPPPPESLDQMCADSKWIGPLKYGTFIAWDPTTGELYNLSTSGVYMTPALIVRNGGWQRLTCVP